MTVVNAIVCDRCGQHQLFDRASFDVLYGWVTRPTLENKKGKWIDVCPACQDDDE